MNRYSRGREKGSGVDSTPQRLAQDRNRLHISSRASGEQIRRKLRKTASLPVATASKQTAPGKMDMYFVGNAV